MSEAGLPGMGLKLGAELLRSPNGVWYSATGADGGTLGVLRFEASVLKPGGAVDRLIERVVAARAGMLPGTLPVVDLVEDGGRIWLITAQVPVAQTAERTETLLLGSTPVSAPGAALGSVDGSRSGGGYPAPGSVLQAPWRPAIDAGGRAYGSGGPPSRWASKDLKDPIGRRLLRAVVGLTLVAVVVGAAAVAGLKLRDKKPTTPVQITGISVHNNAQVQPAGICDTTVDMVAEFTTNGGSGTVTYEWEIPAQNHKTQTVVGAQAVTGLSPKVHLAWRLKLSGSGTVTAKFRITDPKVLAPGADAPSSGDLKYQCP
ncbi:MAG: hypothetical protein ACJ786_32665 [Catenulispora sp.]